MPHPPPPSHQKKKALLDALFFVCDQFGISQAMLSPNEIIDQIKLSRTSEIYIGTKKSLGRGEGEPYIYFGSKNDASAVSVDSFIKVCKSLFKEDSRTWPSVETLRNIIDIASSVNRIRSGDTVFMDICWDNSKYNYLVSVLISYRHYLGNIPNDRDTFMDFRVYHSTHFSEERKYKQVTSPLARFTYEAVMNYIHKSIEYVDTHISSCKSKAHKSVFDTFRMQLLSLQSRLETDKSLGIQSFTDVANRITKTAFQTECQLLMASLQSSYAKNIYFSDSGFADSNCRPVWSTDEERINILQTLRAAKVKNKGLSFKRILLLNTMDVSKYTKEELSFLADDVIFLFEHYVDVVIGDKKLAQKVDHDMFNYAIIDDGTIMRASEEHTEWRVAHVSTSNSEYKKLLANYKSMENDATHQICNLSYQQYTACREWKDPIKRKTLVLLDMQDWMDRANNFYHHYNEENRNNV